MKVLMITDTTKLRQIIYRNDNRMILPVNDGAGNLIISVESLNDPYFSRIRDAILSCTQEVDYIPFPETEIEIAQKYEEFRTQNKLITFDGTSVRYSRTDYTVVRDDDRVRTRI